MLLDSHLPILESLELTRGTLSNTYYRDLITTAAEAVTDGKPISSAFRDSDLIAPSVYEALRSGEQSGQVSPLLLDLADFMDEENEIILRGLISILEPLILIIMGLLERASIWMLVLVIGLTRWTDVARLARAEVLRLRGLAFVDAARCSGASSMRIMLAHLVPNALGPVLVNAAFGVSTAILIEASLSFLGLGVPPDVATWGGMLNREARAWMTEAPWIAVFPGLALSLAVFGFNMLGDALRDVLDPRLRG